MAWPVLGVVILRGAVATSVPGVDAVDGLGWTALQRAAQAGDPAQIAALLQRGANIEASSPQVYRGATPLVLALEYSEAEAAKLLLARGASTAGATGRNALELAARGGLDQIIDLLLARKVPVLGSHALHAAARYGHASTITRLIAAGAKVNDPQGDDHGFTPLIVACQENHLEAAKVLLAAGGNANDRDSDGMPVLHWAVFAARPTEIHEYENLGAPHTTHWVPQQDAPLVGLLIAKGAKLDAVDAAGNTALHHTAMMNARAAATALIAAGAKRGVRNAAGKTALQLARDRKNTVVDVLK
jgi:ankyrin repeat protein